MKGRETGSCIIFSDHWSILLASVDTDWQKLSRVSDRKCALPYLRMPQDLRPGTLLRAQNMLHSPSSRSHSHLNAGFYVSLGSPCCFLIREAQEEAHQPSATMDLHQGDYPLVGHSIPLQMVQNTPPSGNVPTAASTTTYGFFKSCSMGHRPILLSLRPVQPPHAHRALYSCQTLQSWRLRFHLSLSYEKALQALWLGSHTGNSAPQLPPAAGTGSPPTPFKELTLSPCALIPTIPVC